MEQPNRTKISCLRTWVSKYNNNQDQQDIKDVILSVLNQAFPELYADKQRTNMQGWRLIVAILYSFYEIDLQLSISALDEQTDVDSDEGNLCRVLGLVVCAVVQSDGKEIFVQDILAMESQIQERLMTIIQNYMMETAPSSVDMPERGSPIAANSPKAAHNEKNFETPTRPFSASSMSSASAYSSRKTMIKRLQRENDALKEEAAYYLHEYECSKAKLETKESECEGLEIQMKELKIQQDVLALRVEQSQRSEFDSKLREKQEEIDRFTAQLEHLAPMKKQVSELLDEVDLLRPVADKATKLEVAIEKYRERLEKAAGLREQHRRLEDTNRELVQRNLENEAALKQLPTLKKKVEEYKIASTNSAVRVSELESSIQKKTMEITALKDNIEKVNSELREYRSTMSEIRLERRTQEVIDADDQSINVAMGMGVSELNPEISEKLTRLEFENESLKMQLSGETSERIDELQDALDDMGRLKSSFEQKYLSTEEALHSTQQTLGATENTVTNLQVQMKELEGSLEISKKLAQELEITVAEREATIVSLEGRLNDEVHAHQNEVTSLTSELDHEKQTHRASVDQLKLERDEREVMYEQEKQDLREVIEERNMKIDHQRAEFEAAQDVHKRSMATLKEEMEEFKAQHCVSTAQHNEAIEEFKAQLMSGKEMYSKMVEASKIEVSKLKSNFAQGEKEYKKLYTRFKLQREALVQKEQENTQLELKNSQQEAKLRLLEKERAHMNWQVEQQRDSQYTNHSRSLQTDTQLSIVTKELEDINAKCKELQEQLKECQCRFTGKGKPSDISDFLEGMRQMEAEKQKDEDKRRKLILVNAKLVQEQKQFQAKIAKLEDEISVLGGRLNTLQLKEERRSKAENVAKNITNSPAYQPTPQENIENIQPIEVVPAPPEQVPKSDSIVAEIAEAKEHPKVVASPSESVQPMDKTPTAVRPRFKVAQRGARSMRQNPLAEENPGDCQQQ